MSQLIFFSKLGFAGTPPPVFETMSQNMQFFFWPASLKEGTLKIEYIEYFFASFCTEGLINSDHISSFYDILKKASNNGS